MTLLPYTTKTPAYCDNPINEAAFAGFIHWVVGKQEFRQAFTQDTGISLDFIVSAQGLERLIDEATDRAPKAIGAFVDWLIEHHWGEEGKQPQDPDSEWGKELGFELTGDAE